MLGCLSERNASVGLDLRTSRDRINELSGQFVSMAGDPDCSKQNIKEYKPYCSGSKHWSI